MGISLLINSSNFSVFALSRRIFGTNAAMKYEGKDGRTESFVVMSCQLGSMEVNSGAVEMPIKRQPSYKAQIKDA
jgi:hypothetical protein